MNPTKEDIIPISIDTLLLDMLIMDVEQDLAKANKAFESAVENDADYETLNRLLTTRTYIQGRYDGIFDVKKRMKS